MPPLKWEGDVTQGIQVDPDTKTVTVRQSWLNTHADCPERARRNALRLDADPPNDATALGTAAHYAIERAVEYKMNGHGLCDHDDMVRWFYEEWDALVAFGENGLPLRWVKRTPEQAVAYGLSIIDRFYAHVLPILEPAGVEVPFGPVPLGVSATGWTVMVQGTIDAIDHLLGLVDWKSASRAYTPWEKRRWSIQASVYLAAARQGVLPVSVPDVFHYVVFPDVPPSNRDWPVQVIDVTREAAQDGWLVNQVGAIAGMVSAVGFEAEWPMRDQHALCSPKWCPSWDGCRGVFLGADPRDFKSSVTNVTLANLDK